MASTFSTYPMCEPTTIALLVIAAASAAHAHETTRRTANITKDGLKREEDLQQADLARQRDQQFAADAAETNAHAKQAAKESALFDVVAGEYGGGNSVDRARTIGSINTGEQLATLANNSQTGMRENSFRSFSLAEQATSRLNSIQMPSKVGTGLQIVSAGISAYSTQQANQTRIRSAQQPRK